MIRTFDLQTLPHLAAAFADRVRIPKWLGPGRLVNQSDTFIFRVASNFGADISAEFSRHMHKIHLAFGNPVPV